MKTTPTVCLIDASIYIFRAYFSLPDRWHSPEGNPVNALYGYIRFLFSVLNTREHTHLAAAFDESLGSCFRNDIYPQYKCSRAFPDEELAFQLEACQQFTDLMGITALASERYEADDIIATLARICREHNQSVSIVTRDKDLGQLLATDGDMWWDFTSDKRFTKHSFSGHFGVQPEQMVDYLALVGDSVDDVPGVPGIGTKTAAALLKQFGSVEQLYQRLNEVAESQLRGAKRVFKQLQEHRQQVSMAKQLVTLHDRVPITTNYDDLQWQPVEVEEVECFLQEFGLYRALKSQLAHCYWWSEQC